MSDHWMVVWILAWLNAAPGVRSLWSYNTALGSCWGLFSLVLLRLAIRHDQRRSISRRFGRQQTLWSRVGLKVLLYDRLLRLDLVHLRLAHSSIWQGILVWPSHCGQVTERLDDVPSVEKSTLWPRLSPEASVPLGTSQSPVLLLAPVATNLLLVERAYYFEACLSWSQVWILILDCLSGSQLSGLRSLSSRFGHIVVLWYLKQIYMWAGTELIVLVHVLLGSFKYSRL